VKTDADTLVDRYLAELDHAMARLSVSKRHQILAEVSSHITEGRAGLDSDDPASIRALLDRVGDPEAIAMEAGAASPPAKSSDAWVPWLLLFGGFALIVGWFVGVALLWSSHTWRLRDKLIGTFVLPGGLFGLFLLGTHPSAGASCSASESAGGQSVTHCVTHGFSFPWPLGIVVLVVALVAPIATTVHLQTVRRRASAQFG
jgi:HAAS domain-containing protein